MPSNLYSFNFQQQFQPKEDCNQILMAPPKFMYSSIQVSDILVSTVHCKLTDFVFKIFLLFIPEMSVGFMSYIVPIIPIYFTWILKSVQFSLFPWI
jgi:hypothetical protein